MAEKIVTVKNNPIGVSANGTDLVFSIGVKSAYLAVVAAEDAIEHLRRGGTVILTMKGPAVTKEKPMATKKNGTLTVAGEWWKHLRPWYKRLFWKRHRKAEQRMTRQARNSETD